MDSTEVTIVRACCVYVDDSGAVKTVCYNGNQNGHLYPPPPYSSDMPTFPSIGSGFGGDIPSFAAPANLIASLSGGGLG